MKMNMRKRMNKKGNWHITIIVLIILVLSITTWARFAKNGVGVLLDLYQLNKTEQEGSYSVNAVPAGKPSVHMIISRMCDKTDGIVKAIDSNWTVFQDRYLNRIDIWGTYYAIGEITSVQVAGGTNNWLFYKTNVDGDPIADYEGTNRYSQWEMEAIADSALAIQKKLESKNIKFALMVAPNKENVYAEYMPEMYSHSDVSSTDLLIEYIRKNGVNIISPKQELLDNHLDTQLYYCYDTHWNQLGAYIGVRDILLSWEIQMPELANRKITSKELNGNYHYCGEDDLAQMLGLRSVFNDEVEYEVLGTVPMNWPAFKEEQEAGEISYFHNKQAIQDASILLIGDSFRSSMVPSLREQFSDVYVVHRRSFKWNMVEDIMPEYLLVEYVERYSRNISDIDSLFE